MGKVSKEFLESAEEFKHFREQLKDPIVIGTLLNKISEERASYNLLLREINAKLDRLLNLEKRIQGIEAKLGASTRAENTPLLGDTDQQILNFIKEIKHADAETVRKHFSYKGKNAASARLNRLVSLGLLRKQQVGRKVVFVLC